MSAKLHIAAKKSSMPIFKPKSALLLRRYSSQIQPETASLPNEESLRTPDQANQPSSIASPSPGHHFGRMAVWPGASSSIQPKPMVDQRNKQPQGIQRQSVNDPQGVAPLITEETIDLSQDSELAQIPDPSARAGAASGATPALASADRDDELVQTKPLSAFIQRAGDDKGPPRKDYVFLMGSTGGFYVAAKKFFKMQHPEAEIIPLADASLAGIFAKLRQLATDEHPVGNLYIVSHANVDGTLSFGLTKKDKDKQTTFGELKNALANSPNLFALNGGVDAQTKIHIKGCNIGRNLDMLNALDEAFGKDVAVDAPTHKQGYEYHTKGRGKNAKVVSSEFFNSYNVEFMGLVDKSSDELIAAFKEKYAELKFSEQDWEIAVLGATKQGNQVNKAASAQKKAIDARLKASLAALDKAAADYKEETKRRQEEAKTEKATIDSEAKASKATSVAKGSKGVSKKVVMPFHTPLFADKRPPLTEPEILKMAPRWFAKERQKKSLFTGASVEKLRENDQETFSYKIDVKNKDDVYELTYTVKMPAFPETDEDAETLANAQLEKYIAAHPDFAISRAEMFKWRITREKKGGQDIIKAFLEMTIYTIDLDLRTLAGEKIDPAATQGEEFFFGESNVTGPNH